MKTLVQPLALLASHLLASVLIPNMLAQEQKSRMTWVSATNPVALCNDFTRAGFLIRHNPGSGNWIILLEGGGQCYDSKSCKRRFSVKANYDVFMTNSSNQNILHDRDLATMISPLMASLKCFPGLSSSVEGRDILDVDATNNPLFHDYNHVIIPYCSSDLWMGEETISSDSNSECGCFDYKLPSNPNGCFTFDPNSSELQFTFRGKSIFQSIFQQLLTDFEMNQAQTVILAGSDVGGLGAVNNAKWAREALSTSTNLRLILDSSWFIDFHDSIQITFIGRSSYVTNHTKPQHLLDVLMANIACRDRDVVGYPCCLSAYCILTQQTTDNTLAYFPMDVPTFAILSIYDIYMLQPALDSIGDDTDSTSGASSVDDSDNSVMLSYFRIIAEYGGAMNTTLEFAASKVHVYHIVYMHVIHHYIYV